MNRPAVAMLPVDEWLQLVERTPLVSIGLIITNQQGEVLLGWRSNRPAQNCWFVPGGVVRKSESLQQAFQRVVHDELGVVTEASREEVFAGVYEHHYAGNFASVAGVATHYVVLAHRLSLGSHLPALQSTSALPKAQHRKYTWLAVSELLASTDVHEYTKNYFR